VTGRWELRLEDGRVVSWQGASGEEAARRYVDAHRDAVVVAVRRPPVALVVGFQSED